MSFFRNLFTGDDVGRGIVFLMHGDEDLVMPFSYLPPPRIRFTGKTTNWVHCKCRYSLSQKTCPHSPTWPRVTTIKGEA